MVERRRDRLGERKFNATPLLGYWDIFKNYYANKQETNAYVISPDIVTNHYELTSIEKYHFSTTDGITWQSAAGSPPSGIELDVAEQRI